MGRVNERPRGNCCEGMEVLPVSGSVETRVFLRRATFLVSRLWDTRCLDVPYLRRAGAHSDGPNRISRHSLVRGWYTATKLTLLFQK
jgi:hypothetical protein